MIMQVHHSPSRALQRKESRLYPKSMMTGSSCDGCQTVCPDTWRACGCSAAWQLLGSVRAIVLPVQPISTVHSKCNA